MKIAFSRSGYPQIGGIVLRPGADFFPMAYRFGNYRWVRGGTLDNRILGKTHGSVELAHLGKIALQLEGDMQGDLLGKRIEFANPEYDAEYVFDHGAGKYSTAAKYLEGFAGLQEGEVGDIRIDPYFYLEWYSEANGRCVVELDRETCQIL